MEAIFMVLKYIIFGFMGLIGLLVVLAIVFGKRIRKKWEYEAEFRDIDDREFGEFDIELSRIEKEERDYTVKAKLRMRHDSIRAGDPVRVHVEERLVIEGKAEQDGRIFIATELLGGPPVEPSAGQLCRVEIGNGSVFASTLKPD